MSAPFGRIYSVIFTAVSATLAQDLFLLLPAANKPISLHGFYLSNVGGTADAGDAQEELLRIEIIYLPSTVTNGSGGTAPTVQPLNPNDAAAGCTARANDTTVATTGGTAVTKHADGFNVRIPYVYMPPPEDRIPCANANALTIRLGTAPADAILLSGTAILEELF